ncbi:MAG: sulfite reductase subunit alpha [Planctomycetes bacterium]|nr:sulfite reductase subunit alpha [Planctomycetota bacterium]
MAIPVLPDSAPFSPAQRGWLNGFLAGVFGLDRNGKNGVHQPASAPAPVQVEEAFPWHDPALPMDDRLKLADGKPTERVLMAAMAQLDCGSCGYLCQTYAEAIAKGEDKDLTKCSPGGKETAKKLKELVANRKALPMVSQNGHPGSNGTGKAGHGENLGTISHGPYDRKNPFPAPLLKCYSLTQEGSEKDVRFVSFNLKGSGLHYEVGDALGVYPENHPDLVESLLATLGARGDEAVSTPDGQTVFSYEALLKNLVITKVNESCVTLLASCATDPSEASTLKAIADNDAAGVLDTWDLLDMLEQFPSARPSIIDVIATLSPLQPRLYSISSSLKAHAEEVHLTVGVVRYSRADRVRKGVASTFMTEILRPRQRARVFVQTSHGFRLPASGDTPIIMIGPGTGIAPFRAFLEERASVGAKGKNWLFFGDQRRGYDFLYENEIEEYRQRGVLHRIDLAFSRDQVEKIYVQHRMKEQGMEVWNWLQDGAHLYVCGDARRMALDVDQALHAIVAEQGKLSAESAKEYVKELTRGKRYQRDVY